MRPGRQHGGEHGEHVLLDAADPRAHAAEDGRQAHFVDHALEGAGGMAGDPGQGLQKAGGEHRAVRAGLSLR